MPVFTGNRLISLVKASRPPAEAPIPTIGKRVDIAPLDSILLELGWGFFLDMCRYHRLIEPHAQTIYFAKASVVTMTKEMLEFSM
jgi:hypothetical protein